MLDMKKMTTQMIDMYRTAFDNTFSAMMTLQDQMERMTNLYWGQLLAIPEETKKGLGEWTKSHKKHCADFKKAVDEGFKNLEALAA
uniref:Phasin family protein n=1 Tax=Desulfobacca acetoxidans TaxID=60893 RepID=A0A7V4GA29_9BACT